MSTKQFVREQWDRVAGWASVAVGLVALLLGWLGVSDTVYPAEQLPYILSGGIFGLFFLGLGAVLLLSADLRDEWRKLDSIEDALRHVVDEPPPATSNGQAARPVRRPVEARPRSS
jgi:hypothetical protein